MNNILIEKRSGEKERFSSVKLKLSLQRSGATDEQIDAIIKEIEPFLYNGITSKKIYKKAFSLLKGFNRTSASKYSLKKALFDLGPTGYPFEQLISALLKHHGYATKVGIVIDGECVTHEIDVLAKKDNNVYAIECKYHSKSDFVSNVKTPLYINSRFLDIQKKWNDNPKNQTYLKQGWLVTNTKFTDDAISYANCIGLKLMSWDYPEGNGLGANIDACCLYPITVLTTITKREKEKIIKNDVILIKELFEAPNILKKIRISPDRISGIMSELQHLIDEERPKQGLSGDLLMFENI
ncbi:MAG: restriction endonuclease [Saprospiraceae bacterium]|nr:restriction endonuclease [Saprospiraceae bacterium]